jgi:hypothetical protein
VIDGAMMTDQQTTSQSSFSPGIVARIICAVLIIVVISGFSAITMDIIGNKSGSNSTSDIIIGETVFGVFSFAFVVFLCQIAFVKVEINPSEVVYRDIFGVKRFSVEKIDFVGIYTTKNGPDLTVRSGRRYFRLLGLGFPEKSLREIQSRILGAGAEMSKTIATERPEISERAFFGIMYFYVFFIFLTGLGLIAYLVLRAHASGP